MTSLKLRYVNSTHPWGDELSIRVGIDGDGILQTRNGNMFEVTILVDGETWDQRKRYGVTTADGILVGHVHKCKVTFERRTKGNRYVNRRWSSERWTYTHAKEGPFTTSDKTFGGHGAFDTRKEAIIALVEKTYDEHSNLTDHLQK